MGFLRRWIVFGMAASALTASAQVSAPLRPFVTCHFSDGLLLVEKEPTPPNAAGRTAMTLVGPKQVEITRGERLLFGYEGKSPFARVTVEQLPAKSFENGKTALVSAFDKLIASDENVQRNYSLKPQINGFEAHGLDRTSIAGVVVGVYLLIDDATHSVVSVDFLNQPEDARSFATLAEYANLRDAFLNSYTSCLRANLRAGSTPAATVPPAPKKAPAKKTARKS